MLASRVERTAEPSIVVQILTSAAPVTQRQHRLDMTSAGSTEPALLGYATD